MRAHDCAVEGDLGLKTSKVTMLPSITQDTITYVFANIGCAFRGAPKSTGELVGYPDRSAS